MLKMTQRVFSSVHGGRNYSVKSAHKSNKKSSNPRNQAQGEKYAADGSRKVYTKDIVLSISKILKYSSWESARQQLHTLPIKWDSHLINRVLKTHPPMAKAWLFFKWASQLRGFKHDQFTYTTMLDIFGEAGRISSMFFVFNQMRQKGVKIDNVTYTCILHWLSGAGDVDGAVKTWREMKAMKCFPTVVSYTAYVKILFDNNRSEEAEEVYREMLDLGITPNCYTYTVLMVHLAHCGHYESMVDIFHTMQSAGVYPDKAACNILVEKCCESGQIWAVDPILRYMKPNHIVLRYPVYLLALETLQKAGESATLLELANPHLVDSSVPSRRRPRSELQTSCDISLLRRLFSTEKYPAVDRLILESRADHDPLLLSEIIILDSAHCRSDSAMGVYRRCVERGTALDRTVYLSLAGSLLRTGSPAAAADVVGEMVRAGFPLGAHLGAVFIYRLGRAGMIESAVRIFRLLRPEHVCSATYTALISACFSAGCVERAVEVFALMRRRGVGPTRGTYDVMLVGLERAGRGAEARAVHRERRRPSAWSDGTATGDSLCDLLFNLSGVRPVCLNFRGLPAVRSFREDPRTEF